MEATFAGGCFWCTEAAFERVPGVLEATPGYAGGETVEPTYEEVCSGSTGHAEVVRVRFDGDVVSYDDLLDVFFAVHDPTTLNREGPDVGSQYRSAVYYHDESQREAVERKIEELRADGVDVVTEVEPVGEFYVAEDYHHDYYERNPDAGYCRVNVPPKLEKVDEVVGSRG
ncbi:MAG: peptide-methionine (S)-S-oxide reductase MsrA [Halobacteriales archaeon]